MNYPPYSDDPNDPHSQPTIAEQYPQWGQPEPTTAGQYPQWGQPEPTIAEQYPQWGQPEPTIAEQCPQWERQAPPPPPPQFPGQYPLSGQNFPQYEQPGLFGPSQRSQVSTNSPQKKWYHHPAGIVALLICFYPVGLYLMWRHSRWPSKTKWIVTSILATYTLFSVTFVEAARIERAKIAQTRASASSNDSDTSSDSDQSRTLTDTDTPTLEPTDAPEPTDTPEPTDALTPTPTPELVPTQASVQQAVQQQSAAQLFVTITSAYATDNSSGSVSVHTLPGAALTISVTYCNGRSATSESLQGTEYADSAGNYTWTWEPETKCRGTATAYVSASLNGQSASDSKNFTVS